MTWIALLSRQSLIHTAHLAQSGIGPILHPKWKARRWAGQSSRAIRNCCSQATVEPNTAFSASRVERLPNGVIQVRKSHRVGLHLKQRDGLVLCERVVWAHQRQNLCLLTVLDFDALCGVPAVRDTNIGFVVQDSSRDITARVSFQLESDTRLVLLKLTKHCRQKLQSEARRCRTAHHAALQAAERLGASRSVHAVESMTAQAEFGRVGTPDEDACAIELALECSSIGSGDLPLIDGRALRRDHPAAGMMSLGA